MRRSLRQWGGPVTGSIQLGIDSYAVVPFGASVRDGRKRDSDLAVSLTECAMLRRHRQRSGGANG